MCQSKLIRIMEKDRWYTTEELAKKIGISRNAINANLRKMIKYREVERTSLSGNTAIYKLAGKYQRSERS